MEAFFGRDPVLRGANLATRESGIGPDFGQSPYLLHTFPPIHTKLVPQPHQLVLGSSCECGKLFIDVCQHRHSFDNVYKLR